MNLSDGFSTASCRASAVTIEVQCMAPPQDWPELSRLLCSYLGQCLLAAQEAQASFPLTPGKSITWADLQGCRARQAALPLPPAILTRAVTALRVCDMTDPSLLRLPLPYTPSSSATAVEVTFSPILFRLHDDTPSAGCGGANGYDDIDGGSGEGGLPSCTVLSLPHAALEGLWESLSYGESLRASIAVKRDLTEYVQTAMLFSAAGVDVHCISWNRMVLLHGPPGTGKTSLCKALAHKLAVRLCGAAERGHGIHDGGDNDLYRDSRQDNSFHPLPSQRVPASSGGGAAVFTRAKLIEINAHSLFSRWFSESGKQVMQLFLRIRAIAADPDCLVCVLLDEVESLAAARQSAMKGNEPSDSIRVVNALLTQLDSLQHFRNVLVLATSNITGAIDVAFLDRADKKVFVGPPGLEARCTMLQSAVTELLQKGLLYFPERPLRHSKDSANGGSHAQEAEGCEDRCSEDPVVRAMATLELIAGESVGFNGRLLKKLPFLAYAACMSTGGAAAASPLAAQGISSATRAAPAVPASRTLKADFIGGGGADNGNSTPRGAAGGGSSYSSVSSSIPIDTFLECLQDAVRKERSTQAQLAATTQHLTTNC